MKKCTICDADYEGFGFNAYPFEGRCCEDCDNRWVTPSRALAVQPTSVLLSILTQFARLGRIASIRYAP